MNYIMFESDGGDWAAIYSTVTGQLLTEGHIEDVHDWMLAELGVPIEYGDAFIDGSRAVATLDEIRGV